MSALGSLTGIHPNHRSRGSCRTSGLLILAALALVAGVVTPVTTAGAATGACPDWIPGAGFSDVAADNVHGADIDCIAHYRITTGTSPTTYGPGGQVTRWQMALFLTRTLKAAEVVLPDGSGQGFADLGSLPIPYQTAINQLAQLGITHGTSPTTYAPHAVVTRTQMALFLTRLLQVAGVVLPDGSDQGFTDLGGLPVDHQVAVNQLAQLGITRGTTPTTYSPQRPVRRQQMASFLARSLNGLGAVPPPILAVPSPVDIAALGARVGGAVEQTVFVDAGLGSDGNSGTSGSPLRTIGEALRRAREGRKQGQGWRIVVRPGTYRESLEIGDLGPSEPRLILEASGPGAIVSGSDVWTAWSPEGSGVYSHSWAYNWGLADQGVQPIVARREMVFVNGVRMEQVLSRSQLSEGTFFVDEGADRIFVRPAAGFDLRSAKVEVAIRDSLLILLGSNNVTVQGLQFTHAANPFGEPAVLVASARDVELADNQVIWNNWTGLAVSTSSRITLVRNDASHNGGGGMGAFKPRLVLFDGNETSYNNWRGVAGDYTGWSIAAVKSVGARSSAWLNHTSIGNWTRGFWLDYDIRDILIEGARFCGNHHDGVFVEASPGPVLIEDSTLCENGRYGLHTGNVVDLAAQGNFICDNEAAGIHVGGDAPTRTITDGETGQEIALPVAERLTLLDNTVIAGGASPLVIGNSMQSAAWREAFSSLRSDDNTFYSFDPSVAFSVDGGKASFAAWRSATGQDAHSVLSGTRPPGSCS